MKKFLVVLLGVCIVFEGCQKNTTSSSAESETNITDFTKETENFVESDESIEAGTSMQDDETFNQNKYEYPFDEEKGRYLIWTDEFEEDSINSDVWTMPSGYLRNGELQYYTKDAISIQDGIATIQATRDDSYEGFSWISGEMELLGRQAFQNCYMEARIKMDTDKGFCPAFWTMGDTIQGWNWPKCGEVDIFEIPGTSIDSNTHSASSNDTHLVFGGKQVTNIDYENWHTYGMEMNDGMITLFLDGEEINVIDTSQYEFYDGVNPFKLCQYPILNIAVGGMASYGEPDPSIDEASMDIDYVKVYTLKDVTLPEVVPTGFHMEYIGKGDRFKDCQIVVGDKVQLFPIYEPQTSVGGAIVSSIVENEEICTCKCGYITALSPGETKIVFTDSNGLVSEMNVSVLETKATSSIDGCWIEEVDLNRTDIWGCGYYGNGVLSFDSARVYTIGYANMLPNTSYKFNTNGITPAMFVTIFDENKQFIKSYDSSVEEFTTPDNAAYCAVTVKFVEGTLKADNYSRIMELIPAYEFSIQKK